MDRTESIKTARHARTESVAAMCVRNARNYCDGSWESMTPECRMEAVHAKVSMCIYALDAASSVTVSQIHTVIDECRKLVYPQMP